MFGRTSGDGHQGTGSVVRGGAYPAETEIQPHYTKKCSEMVQRPKYGNQNDSLEEIQ